MLSIYDIKQQRMLDQPDFLALIDDYRTFAGVSFVGSFKIIEQELLPRFKQVDLILGMEDRKTGRSLAQVFNLEDKLAELQKAGAPFIDRLKNRTLRLRFTKEDLFHSKYFIVSDDHHFAIFNGSMNLTKQAMTKNHEVLWMYQGDPNDPADQAFLTAHQALFNHNFNQDATDYLSRRVIDQIKPGNEKQLSAMLADDTIDQLTSKAVIVNPTDIQKITNGLKKEQVVYDLTPTGVETMQALYTPKGNQRRDPLKIRQTVKQLTYQVVATKNQEVASAEDFFPQPRWAYANDQLLVEDGAEHRLHPLAKPSVSDEDVRTFVDIIKSFKENKLRDESPQALSAFMYLMTAPLIWRIRQIYRSSNFGKSADQVPLSMVLIGRGTTGKTQLVRDYFQPFIVDQAPSIQFSQINGGPGPRLERSVAFLGKYLNSGRFVSPMIVDELNSNFLHSKVATNAIKQWSNTLEGVHNVNIFAMNHNAGDKDINNLEEITKRVYYLSFEAGWKESDQQPTNYQILQNSVNDHLYHYVTHELNLRLADPTGHDEQMLVDDYLSITREILKSLLKAHGYLEELAGIIDTTYDYKVDRNRLTWKMLIRDDNFAHVSFTEGDNQHFTVSKVIFNDLRGTSYENTNQTLDNYFNMFPREMGVAIDLYDNGMLLDIDKFDAFIGEPLIRSYYQKLHQKEDEQATITDLFKAQQAQLQQQQEQMKQLTDRLNSKPSPAKKEGLLHRLFK